MIDRADEGHGVVLAGGVVVVLGEDDDVIRDADAGAVGEGDGHDDALVVDVGAVAAAEVDELELPAVVAADDGVLPRDERAETEADGVFAGPADGRGVPDRDFEGDRRARAGSEVSLPWGDWQFAGCTLREVRKTATSPLRGNPNAKSEPTP